MAIALSPGLAPILGGYLTHYYGWKMCFNIVSFVGALLVLLLFFFMPETLSTANRTQFSVQGMKKGYKKAFQNKRFLILSLIPSLMIGGLWAWMTALPILFINYLDVPIHLYGYYGFAGVGCYVLGTFINSKLVNKIALKTLLLTGLSLCFLSTLLLIAAGYGTIRDPLVLQALNFPFAFGLAFILPNGTALAFSEVREGLGTSSALLGSLEMAVGAMGVFLVGYFFDGTIISIAILMLVATLLSFGLYFYLDK